MPLDRERCASSEKPGCVQVSVPARTEVAGNHQDHQGGCVIASAVDRRITCAAQRTAGSVISVASEGQGSFSLDLSEGDFALPRESERNTACALVRGMAAKLMQRGFALSGCHLAFASDIPIGMGLSSSAAFELCAGSALLAVSGGEVSPDCAPADGLTPLEMARMAMHVEQEYFGKPCGLMDQASCALGGMVFMDFADVEKPEVSPIDIPEQWHDYAYLLISAGSGHEGATPDYVGVAADMRAVAEFLGISHLRDMGRAEYVRHMTAIRAGLGDAAALRALGFYIELDLVQERLRALQRGDIPAFMSLTADSGICSAEYLQNVAVPGRHEPAMVALAMCRMALGEMSDTLDGSRVGSGSARIHGGGFGGTIQVIMPLEHADRFESRINELMGFDCCMHVRLGARGICINRGA